MTGYTVKVTENENVDLAPYAFNFYDNGELVVSGADNTFTYLIDETLGEYEGIHKLELSYYLRVLPAKESAKTQVYEANFTLPPLNLSVEVTVI